MIRIILNCGDFFYPRAQYVWETFFRYYRTPDEVQIERYTESEVYDGTGNFFIYCGITERSERFPSPCLALIQKQEIIDSIQNRIPPQQMGDPLQVFPALSPAGLEQNISKINGRITSQSEEVTTCFILLSAYEEAVSGAGQLDIFGRFRYSGSLIERLQIHDRPVVNQVFEVIAGWLKELGADIQRVPFPDGKRFVVIPSHDIDRLSFFASGSAVTKISHFLADLIKYNNTVEAFAHLEGLFTNPHDTFAKIVKLHGRLRGRSSFFFVFNSEARAMDPDYQVNSQLMYKCLHMLDMNGQEIGLHGSFGSIVDGSFRAELALAEEMTGKSILGGRIHYLRMTIQRMFEILAGLSIKYDATVGFAEVPGFRTGFGLPHLMFDHDHDCPFETLEIPLNLMDTTFFDKRYLGLDSNRADNLMNHFIRIASEQQLCLTILTHNDFYHKANFKKVARYKKLLSGVNAAGGLITDYRQIQQWWQDLGENSPVKAKP